MTNIKTSHNLETNSLKKKEQALYLSIFDFMNFDIFYRHIISTCNINTRYSILIRVCYINNSEVTDWRTLGDQMGFICVTTNDMFNYFKQFHKIVLDRLEYAISLYDIKDQDIIGMQLMIYKVDYTDIVVKKQMFLPKSLGPHKELVNVSKVYDALNRAIPLTMEMDKFGTLLQKNVVNGKVDTIILKDGSIINFTERINKYLDIDHKIDKFSSNVDFYQYILNDIDNIIIIESLGKQKIIDIYNLDGVKKHHLVDTKVSDNGFTRKISNVTVYINNTGIYNKDITINFDPVYPNKISGPQSKLIHPDWRVGTLDIETYKDNDNVSRPYAAGFYANNTVNTYYIDEDLNSDNVIIKCLDGMLIEKYNRYTFYVHNFGRFDVVFILKVIITTNELYPNKYTYNIIFRDDVILSIEISSKVNNKNYTIKLVDSYTLLQSSLSELCKTFDTEVKKSVFPYDFVSKYNLFYVGNKPDIKYYNKIDIKSYEEVHDNNWSLKEETIRYLENDLISLFNVIDEFKRKIYINYHTHITRSLTISGLSMDIFLRRFYDKNIPLINKKSIYMDIKNSYFGGITEVYKPYGKKLFYYDVNSLYPYAALNPMPGLHCIYKYNINKNIVDCLDNLFGFYYCKINASDLYLGLLPVRKDGGIYMPLGYIEGWYFSEELKFAYQHGYKIEILKGYEFNKSENVFNKYIEEFYKIKSTTTDEVMKSIAKSLLNNLLGRFGLNIDKSITELVSQERYYEILQYKPIKSVKYIGDKVLVTHGSDISMNICNSHNVDFHSTFSNEIKRNIKSSNYKEDHFHDVSIAVASAVTSYARIFMNKIKLDILDKGGSIYYTDTDSIVTDIELDKTLVGHEIGKFKLECEISEAYFISNKTYCIKKLDGKVIIKAKGTNSKSINWEDFVKLYSGSSIESTRNETVKDYSIGSVSINVSKNIVLSANSYNKRVKIFDQNKKWIDTRPIIQRQSYHTYTNTSIKQLLEIVREIFMFLLYIILFTICFYMCLYIYNYGNNVEVIIINNTNFEELKPVNQSNMWYKSIIDDFFNKFTSKGKAVNIKTCWYQTHIANITPIENENHSDKFEIINKVKSKHMNDLISECEYYKDKASILELELLKMNLVHEDLVRNINNIVNNLNKSR